MKKTEVRLKVGFDGREGLRLETEDRAVSIGCTWGRDKHLCAERLADCWNALTGIQKPAAIPEVVEALKAICQYGSDTLSGRADGGLDDREWQRDAVIEMTKRARTALAKLERGQR